MHDSEEDDVDDVAGGIDDNRDENLTDEASTTARPRGLWRNLKTTFYETMRDALIIFILTFTVTQIVQESGYKRFRFVATESVPPEAAVPKGLQTKSFATRNTKFITSDFVADYPLGNVYEAFTEADRHQDVFVMYYATWDGDSLHAIAAFAEAAAVYASKTVHFASIHCWHPKSDCVKEFSRKDTNSFHFPLFVFYPKDRKGVQYNGPLKKEEFLRFLASATRPVHHLLSLNEWTEFRAKYGGSLLTGFFPNLYTNVHNQRQFRRLLNAAYIALEVDPFRAHFGGFGVVTDASLAFSLHLNQTSIPVRYTLWNGTSYAYPNKTLASSVNLFNWIKTKAHGAELVPWVGVAGRKSVTLGQRLSRGSGNSLLVFLKRTNSIDHDPNYRRVMEAALRYYSCNQSSVQQQALIDRLRGDSGFCDVCQACQKNMTVTHANIKSFTLETDEQIRQMKEARHELNCGHCRQSSMQQGIGLLQVEDLDGLSCEAGNKTLNIYAVDRDSNVHLAKSMGLDESSPYTVIVSLKEELIYSSNDLTLSQFIGTYHERPSTLHRLRVSKPLFDGKESDSSIEEINGQNFESKVMNSKVNIVLLYRTTACAFCAAASPVTQVFHSVHRILKSLLHIKFVAVDANFNDLPWHFTALSVPTVLFFPKESKSETRVFPSKKPLTTLNVLNFVIANLNRKERLELAAQSCVDPDCNAWLLQLQQEILQPSDDDRSQQRDEL